MISAGVYTGGFVFIIGIYLIISHNLPFYFCNGLMILVLALVIGIPTVLIFNHNKEVEKKYRGMQIANIDSMTGIEFEQYLKRILTNQGYSVSMTDVSGDLGVDLVASGNGNRIAIQAKRHSDKVSRRAISDAVAGMNHYGCNKAMVITNNYFSPGAIVLAKSTDCILIDRDTLAKWVNEFQNTDSQIAQLPNPYIFAGENTATVECKDCKNMVLPSAEVCPKCGAKFPASYIPSEVTLHRKKILGLSLYTLTIFVDDVEIGELKEDDELNFKLACGNHTIRAKHTFASGEITIVTLPAKAYKIDASISAGLLKNHVNFQVAISNT